MVLGFDLKSQSISNFGISSFTQVNDAIVSSNGQYILSSGVFTDSCNLSCGPSGNQNVKLTTNSSTGSRYISIDSINGVHVNAYQIDCGNPTLRNSINSGYLLSVLMGSQSCHIRNNLDTLSNIGTSTGNKRITLIQLDSTLSQTSLRNITTNGTNILGLVDVLWDGMNNYILIRHNGNVLVPKSNGTLKTISANTISYSLIKLDTSGFYQHVTTLKGASSNSVINVRDVSLNRSNGRIFFGGNMKNGATLTSSGSSTGFPNNSNTSGFTISLSSNFSNPVLGFYTQNGASFSVDRVDFQDSLSLILLNHVNAQNLPSGYPGTTITGTGQKVLALKNASTSQCIGIIPWSTFYAYSNLKVAKSEVILSGYLSSSNVCNNCYSNSYKVHSYERLSNTNPFSTSNGNSGAFCHEYPDPVNISVDDNWMLTYGKEDGTTSTYCGYVYTNGVNYTSPSCWQTNQFSNSWNGFIRVNPLFIDTTIQSCTPIVFFNNVCSTTGTYFINGYRLNYTRLPSIDSTQFTFSFYDGSTLQPVYNLNTALCNGSNLILRSDYGSGANWFRNNQLFTSNSQNCTTSVGGIYRVEYANIYGCISSSANLTVITKNNNLSAISGPTNVYSDSIYSYSVNSSGSNVFWNSALGSILTANNINNIQIEWPTGNYFDTIQVSSFDGNCSWQRHHIVNVAQNDIGINEVSSRLVISPNPTGSYVSINRLNSVVVYNVYDITGQKVAEGKTEGHIDLTNLPAGHYKLLLYSKEGSSTHTIQKL